MTRSTVKTGSALLALLGLVTIQGGLPVSADSKAPYSHIVTFGTSLSDSGNAFVLIDENGTPPDYDVDGLWQPFSPYARGGNHLTNGATWIEQFSRLAGLAPSGLPAFRGVGSKATNYAVGGARAYDAPGFFNLSDQVAASLADTGGHLSPEALYAIEIGANDARDALVAFPQDPQQSAALVTAGVASVAESIAALYQAGARHFLVWTVPDISLTPAVRALDAAFPGTATVAMLLTQSFNAGLTAALAQLSALPGIDIRRLDAFSLIHAIVADPAPFGVVNVTTPCITPGVEPFACQKPSEFLFWDGIHPTTAVHGILAREAAAALDIQ